VSRLSHSRAKPASAYTSTVLSFSGDKPTVTGAATTTLTVVTRGGVLSTMFGPPLFSQRTLSRLVASR
jgi:hypothetical protein